MKGGVIWVTWAVLIVAATANLFRWHLDYFRSPGPLFHTLAIIAIPALAILAWLYSAVRKRGLWRYEPLALAVLIVAACLRYEPRAFAVSIALFLACYGAGNLALRKFGIGRTNPVDRLTAGFGAGAGLLITALALAGWLRLLYPLAFLSILAAAFLISHREIRGFVSDLRSLQAKWRTSQELTHPITGIAIPFGFTAALCSLMIVLAPSVAFDSVAMHLPSVQYYAATHALQPVPGIEYSFYPQGFELLWTLAYSLAGQAGAQMVSAIFFLVFLLILVRAARLCDLDGSAAVTAVILAATLPFLHWTGSVMKNDMAEALFISLSLVALLQWLDSRNFRWILTGAFFMAQAFGVKYVALFSAPAIALLYGYALWNQRPRWRAALAVGAVFLTFSIGWPLRAYLLTGNPVAPDHLGASMGKSIGNPSNPAPVPRVLPFLERLWNILYPGNDAFESPLPAPAGIILVAFLPVGILARRARWLTSRQIACIVFGLVYFAYWAFVVDKVRYAIVPYSLAAIAIAAWIHRRHGQTSGAGRMALAGLVTYALLISTMGLLIVGMNGPQIAYFAGRLDKPGYLREAMHAYGAVEFLHRTGQPHARVFGIENLARAYAPDPYVFTAIWCSQRRGCQADAVARQARDYRAEYLIAIDSGVVPEETLTLLGSPERVYRDAYFSVYRLPAPR
jgi:hypothetical protein